VWLVEPSSSRLSFSLSARLRLDIWASRLVSIDVAAVEGLLPSLEMELRALRLLLLLLTLLMLLMLLTLFMLDDSDVLITGADGASGAEVGGMVVC
jgi:hypothetical protein